ncbi:MAG: RDD family protein [Marinibacterium sp.]|nr:RDD family protein [Marinibacterium sp.]
MSPFPDPQMQPQFYDGVPSKRLVAWFVDTILILLLAVVLLPFTAFTGIFFFPFMVLVVGFAYRVVTLANGSATLGMRFAAVELRGPDGRPFDTAMAFWHTAGYTVSVALPIIQVVSIVLMLTSERKQGLTDHLLGTVALARRAQL